MGQRPSCESDSCCDEGIGKYCKAEATVRVDPALLAEIEKMLPAEEADDEKSLPSRGTPEPPTYIPTFPKAAMTDEAGDHRPRAEKKDAATDPPSPYDLLECTPVKAMAPPLSPLVSLEDCQRSQDLLRLPQIQVLPGMTSPGGGMALRLRERSESTTSTTPLLTGGTLESAHDVSASYAASSLAESIADAMSKSGCSARSEDRSRAWAEDSPAAEQRDASTNCGSSGGFGDLHLDLRTLSGRSTQPSARDCAALEGEAAGDCDDSMLAAQRLLGQMLSPGDDDSRCIRHRGRSVPTSLPRRRRNGSLLAPAKEEKPRRRALSCEAEAYDLSPAPAGLAPINGCMPRFPPAEVGEGPRTPGSRVSQKSASRGAGEWWRRGQGRG
eukprot:TRINITY_DN16799_c0_g1_i1.p1 TRINITY_DN16799_c0_g1~~TRINITY_DN16799_c0_g1_i1.p1  ORF type:complete len:384 (-),score=77.26 TRINITY_DN16799_c0_g1_i1:115-1266(-)